MISESHVISARMETPMTAAVKYSLDFSRFFSDSPRSVLIRTLPPMPISRPRLYMMFQIGLMTAIAAVPCGP